MRSSDIIQTQVIYYNKKLKLYLGVIQLCIKLEKDRIGVSLKFCQNIYFLKFTVLKKKKKINYAAARTIFFKSLNFKVFSWKIIIIWKNS